MLSLPLMKNQLHYMLTSIFPINCILSVADTTKPVIDHPEADKTDSCWVVVVQLRSAFVDLITATDDSSSLGNDILLIASPYKQDGNADVDTRFQGTTIVTYKATDPSENTSTQCIKYLVKDLIVLGPLG